MPDFEKIKKGIEGKIEKEKEEKLIESLTAYYQLFKELSGENARRMSPDDHKLLSERFNAAYNNCLDVSEAINQTDPKAVPEELSKCIYDFTNQYMVIKKITDKKEYIRLASALDNETNKILEGDMTGAQVVGDGQNRRIVVNAVDRNGRIMTGVVTKEVRTTDAMLTGDTIQGQLARSQLLLQAGERLDSRNSAMSDIAKLLGRGDLIANSQQVKYKENGQTKSASFMEFVDGTDLDKLSTDKRERYYNIDLKDTFTSKLKKSAIDLTIIDFLCFNIDRHSGNILYKYKKCGDKKIRLDGIVGIDNDSCLPAQNTYIENQPFNRLQALDDTVVISESMAREIMNLRPEVLAAVIMKNDVRKASAEAACQRLAALKERISRGKEFSEKLVNPGADGEKEKKKILIDPIKAAYDYRREKNIEPFIMVVPDKDIRYLSIRNIAKRVNSRQDGAVVCGVCSMLDYEHTEDRIDLNKADAKEKYGHLKNRAPKLKLTTKSAIVFCREVNARLEEYKKNEKGFANHAGLFENINNLAAMTDAMGKSTSLPKKEDMELINKCFEAVKLECENFKTKIDGRYAGKSTKSINDANRYNFVTQISSEMTEFSASFTDIIQKQQRALEEEELIRGDEMALNAKAAPKKQIRGSIAREELIPDFARMFGSSYSNDKDVASWKKGLKGKTQEGWILDALDFDFPAKYEASHDYANQLQAACEDLSKTYLKVTGKDDISLSDWHEKLAPKIDNMRILVDQYNAASDFIYLDDPKMHALSNVITELQNMSDKVTDKILENQNNSPEIKDENKVEDNRYERLHNKLQYYSFIIDNGAEKHSNSKEFLKMRGALDAIANSAEFDSNMLSQLSAAAGEYLTKKSGGIHVKKYADPVREYRLDIAKNLKMIADANIQRIKTINNNEPEAVKENFSLAR